MQMHILALSTNAFFRTAHTTRSGGHGHPAVLHVVVVPSVVRENALMAKLEMMAVLAHQLKEEIAQLK